MRFGAALMLVAMIAFLPACAKKSTTENAPANAGATTTAATPGTSVQQATVQTSQGKVTMGQGAVDPNNLGLPVYPGATPIDAGSYSMQTAQGSAQIVTVETHDAYDKVIAFYKDKMPPGTQSFLVGSGSTASAQFVVGKDTDKSKKQIIIAQSNGAVRITMLVGTNQ